MHVLFQNRADAFTKPGGDTVLMVKTKEALERLGVQVAVQLGSRVDYGPYDIVHVYNIITYADSQQAMEAARAAGKPVALQPSWWTMTDYEVNRIRRPAWSRVRRILGTALTGRLFSLWHRHRRPNFRCQLDLLRHADVLLLAANAERRVLAKDFGSFIYEKPCQVTANGLDKSVFYDADPKPFVEKYGLRDFVLCASRIENRKNQLQLLIAMREIDAPLVLIGQPNPNQQDYVALCRAEAGRLGPSRVLMIDRLEQKELASAYAAAKVHALPSWYEVASLASMEAAVAGCNIVTTDRTAVDEYFGTLAWCCDPSSVRSIRNAIRAALAAPRTTALRDKVASEFSWEKTALQTLKGYERVLAKR